ncbi:MAG: phage tail spike protein [Faecalibacillus faecis]|uniref:phage tail spike protein n=1 Tax=Faecalibacillus faecis TaxID=1982628 RepID=UPI003991BAAF
MIIYLADRHMNIVATCSNNLPKGLKFQNDLKSEDVESGVATFSVDILYDEEDAVKTAQYCESGNYVLVYDDNGENGFYTIIEAENDRKEHSINIYAEDGGLDLLNEVVDAYTANGPHPIAFYIEKFSYDSGFEIGLNEVSDLNRTLSWTGQDTCTARILSVANSFDAEIGFSFTVKNMTITHKYINIYKKRGNENVAQLRLNTDIDNIIVKSSISDLTTCLIPNGGTPEGSEHPITLAGYSYDDGDIYINELGWVASRSALAKWSRYQWETYGNYGGHIVKYYSYDTTSQSELCNRSISYLKKYYDIIYNYEVDIAILPDNVRIGDTINIIDENGELYLNARVLKLETSSCDKTATATLGDFLIKSGGINEKVKMMAEQFKDYVVKQREQTYKTQQLAKSALTKANEASSAATNASKKADDAKTSAADAITNSNTAINQSNEAINKAQQANQSAGEAKTSAETALTKIDSATADLKKAQDNINSLKSDISSTNKSLDELAKEAGETKETLDGLNGDLQETKETLKLSYAKKTDLSSTEASLKAEITKSATELSSKIERTYAGKSELTDIQGKLQSQITQNAEGLTSQSSKIDKLENDTTDAQLKITAASEAASKAQSIANKAQTAADNAKTAANKAQTAADEAASKATSAQQKANEAKTTAEAANNRLANAESDLSAAKENLKNVTADVNATKEQVEEAQNAVTEAEKNVAKAMKDATDAQNVAKTAQSAADAAKTTANTAQDTANKAKANADEATKTANLAKETANKAQETVAGLTKRVTSAETNISQNSEAISASASKITEIGNKLTNDYYSKTETDAAIKIESDKIDSIVHRVDTIDSVSNEAITQATQTADRFSWLVKSGTSESDFLLTDRTASLVSEYINLNGLVEFNGLNSTIQNQLNILDSWGSDVDKTYINGGKLWTRSITAEKLAVDAIKSKNYVANSAGSFLNLSNGSFDSKYLKWDSSGKITSTGGTIGGITINDGNLTASDTNQYHKFGWIEGEGSGDLIYRRDSTEIMSKGLIKLTYDATISGQSDPEGPSDMTGTTGYTLLTPGAIVIQSTRYNGGSTSIYSSSISTGDITVDNITAESYWGNFRGYLQATSGWAGRQYFSSGEWVGWYDKQNGTRKGWIGHDGSSHFCIRNETNNGIILHPGSNNTTRVYGYLTAGYLRTITDGSGMCQIWDSYDNNNARMRMNINSSYRGGWGCEYHFILHSNGMNSFRPGYDGGANLGTSNCRWSTVYSTSGSVSTSDMKQKDVIDDYDFKARDFIMGLKPIAYRLNAKGASGKRIHMGFGAQPVYKLINNLELGDLSLVEAWKIREDSDIEEPYYGEKMDDKYLRWGMKYEELLAPLVALVQEQQIKIEKLEKIIGGN